MTTLLITLLVITVIALAVTIGNNIRLRRDKGRKEDYIRRLEWGHRTMREAYLAKKAQLKQVEQRSVPTGQVPTDEEINSWLERAGR